MTYTLSKEYGIIITFEEAPLIYSGDRIDVATTQGNKGRYFNPRGGELNVELETTENGLALKSPMEAVAKAVGAYNQSGYPGRYKLDAKGDYLHIVPVARANTQGEIQAVQSPLDQIVTIKAAGRFPQSVLRELLDAVSAKSGYVVRIGQSPFLSGDQPVIQNDFSEVSARTVLRELAEKSRRKRIWYLLYDIRSGIYYLSII